MTDVNADIDPDIHKFIDDWEPGTWDDLKSLLHRIVDHSYNSPEITESTDVVDSKTDTKET